MQCLVLIACRGGLSCQAVSQSFASSLGLCALFECDRVVTEQVHSRALATKLVHAVHASRLGLVLPDRFEDVTSKSLRVPDVALPQRLLWPSSTLPQR